MNLQEATQRLNLEVDLVPRGNPNRPGTLLRPTFVTIHNTGNSGRNADARMHARFIKQGALERMVSWHYTVDDLRCIKHLPTTEKAFHAISGNRKSLGIEVCQHQGINQEEAIERACLLAAVLMFALRIPIENLVTHKFWTGKECPGVILNRFPGGFERFKQIAQGFLSGIEADEGPSSGLIEAPIRGLESLGDLVDTEEPQPLDAGNLGFAGGSLEERVGALEQQVLQLTAALRDAQLDLHEDAHEDSQGGE